MSPHAASSRSWTAHITPEMREQLIELHRINPWAHLKILLLLAIWATCGLVAIHVDILAVRIAAWMVIGLVLHGLGVFMHEGAHAALFRKKPLDRAIGFVCGLPLFFSCSNYRATHVLHHRYENSARDPDNLQANFPIKFVRGFVYWAWYIFGMPLYIILTTVTGPFRARGWREKTACLVETALIIGFHTLLFKAASRLGWWDVLLNGWILAMPFAVLIANVRGLAEHTMLWHAVPPDPLIATRTTLSNRVVSFFFNNQNYHLEHHLFPGLPWNNLPKANRVLQPIYRERGASVARGYLQYLAGAVRYGPLRNLSYRADHSFERDYRA